MSARLARSTAWLLASSLVALAGCTVDTPSTLCDTPNDAIVVDARVDDSGNNVHIELAFHVEDEAVSRPFCVDDAVRVNGRTAAALRKPNGHTVFTLNLGKPASAYTVEVDRGDATHTVRATPSAPAFELTSPSASTEHSRAAPLMIAWTPPVGDAATITLVIGDVIDGATCLDGLYSAEIPDTGAYELVAQSLAIAEGQLESKTTCDGFIELVRTEAVDLEHLHGDPFHADSRLLAATERTLAFTSIP